MRILTLTNLYPNPFQPLRAHFNRRQIRALALRHEVRIISPIAWTDELKARWRGASPLPRGRQLVFDGIPVEHPRYFYPPKMLRGWYGHFFRWSVKPAFQRALASFRPEVIFAPWAYPDAWAALRLGKQAGLPVVVKLHGSDLLQLRDCPGRERGTVEVLREANGIMAVSRDLAQEAIARGADPSRVRVVYCGLDHTLFKPGDRAEARSRLSLPQDLTSFLFVGNLVSVKGLDVLLEACALLAPTMRFQCNIIGQGPLQGTLEAQAARLGLTDRIRFVGPRPNVELPDWYRAANLFILPSRSEGVPSVLLEAISCGTPFVASRVGGIPEIAHFGSGRLVPAESPPALAGAIQDLLVEAASPAPSRTRFTRTCNDAAAELTTFFEEVIQAFRDRTPSRQLEHCVV
jgi:glycosyltransferase involved in cell wall biosynthesis